MFLKMEVNTVWCSFSYSEGNKRVWMVAIKEKKRQNNSLGTLTVVLKRAEHLPSQFSPEIMCTRMSNILTECSVNWLHVEMMNLLVKIIEYGPM